MRIDLILLTTSALATLAGSAQAQETLVLIAHVGALSGGMAAYGRDNENGVRLAIEELNARGVTIGQRKARFELLAEDDHADPKQATSVAQKLCDRKVNGVIGHMTSGTTIPAAKIYNDCGVPMITVGATNPKLTQLGYRTTFRMNSNDNTLGAAVATYGADKLGLKTVAVIDDRTAYGNGVAEVFKAAALAKGMRVVDQQYTDDKAIDFAAILTIIKAKNPEALFYGGTYSQAGPMLRQMEQLGMRDIKFLGGDGICNPNLGELSGGAKTAENVICIEGGKPIEKGPASAGAPWRARYDARFPNQFQIGSPYTYDATMVLVDAMTRAGSADPALYAPRLFDTDYRGVMNRYSFDANGDLKNPTTTVYVYRDGRKVSAD